MVHVPVLSSVGRLEAILNADVCITVAAGPCLLARPQRGPATCDASGARQRSLGGAHRQAPREGHITNQPIFYKEEKEHRCVLTTCMRTGRWPGELQLPLDLLS